EQHVAGIVRAGPQMAGLRFQAMPAQMLCESLNRRDAGLNVAVMLRDRENVYGLSFSEQRHGRGDGVDRSCSLLPRYDDGRQSIGAAAGGCQEQRTSTTREHIADTV